MVVIRLTRGGAKGRPFYTVVATDKQNRRDGSFLERLGYYNPMATQSEVGVRIATDRIDHWRGQGAQVSPTVERLIKLQASQPAAA